MTNKNLQTLPIEDTISQELQKQIEIQATTILQYLGASPNELGTYLYKNMIVAITLYLKKNSTKNPIETYKQLMKELNNNYSQFYQNTARNELDIGIKTFHSKIKQTTDKIKQKNTTFPFYTSLLTNTDYKEQAFLIGLYISNQVELPLPEPPHQKKKTIQPQIH